MRSICRKYLVPAFIPLTLLFCGPVTADAGQVRHLVIFKYKDGASAEQIQAITDSFRQLQQRIPGILTFEYGINNSPEGLNRGLTHVYMLTFADAAARDAYLPHPEHGKFGEMVMQTGILDEVFVIDYEPRDSNPSTGP